MAGEGGGRQTLGGETMSHIGGQDVHPCLDIQCLWHMAEQGSTRKLRKSLKICAHCSSPGIQDKLASSYQRNLCNRFKQCKDTAMLNIRSGSLKLELQAGQGGKISRWEWCVCRKATSLWVSSYHTSQIAKEESTVHSCRGATSAVRRFQHRN